MHAVLGYPATDRHRRKRLTMGYGSLAPAVRSGVPAHSGPSALGDRRDEWSDVFVLFVGTVHSGVLDPLASTKRQTAARGGYRRAWFASLTIALVLAPAVLASACSSGGGGGGLASECQTARKKFRDWIDTELAADNALTHAANQWNASGRQTLVPGPAFTAAVDQYNADLQTFRAARTRGDQDLAAVTQALGNCDQAKVPQACQAEFATYKPIMDNHAADRSAQDAAIQSIADEQQAIMSLNTGAYTAARDRQQAAITQSNDLGNTYNTTLKTAYNDALNRCNNAT